MSEPDRSRGETYGSASDLPSVIELRRQIAAFKLITRFVMRKERANLVEMEAGLRHLTSVVDAFYVLLGPRNWVFHDTQSLTAVEALLGQPVDEAEESLIAAYEDLDDLRIKVGMLRRFEAMKLRRPLLQRALDDYQAGRYYSVVLVLLTVMDGFVNDIDVAQRRGLHAREAEELAAWDSVVGHHKGLTSAHRTFRRGFRKTSDQPVDELFRNGILHGTLTNFDNRTVAAKAWNRLFAVADWAASMEKASAPVEPDPSFREVLSKAAAGARQRKALDAWEPSVLVPGDDGFATNDAYVRAACFFDAWRDRNFGKMASVIPSKVALATTGMTAGMLRDEFDGHRLIDYRVVQLAFVAAAAVEVRLEIRLGDEFQPAFTRWIRETSDGEVSALDLDGDWVIYARNPWVILHGPDVDGSESER